MSSMTSNLIALRAHSQGAVRVTTWNKQPGFHKNCLYYANNALLIIQPGVEIPCFILGLPWYIVQYTPWGVY